MKIIKISFILTILNVIQYINSTSTETSTSTSTLTNTNAESTNHFHNKNKITSKIGIGIGIGIGTGINMRSKSKSKSKLNAGIFTSLERYNKYDNGNTNKSHNNLLGNMLKSHNSNNNSNNNNNNNTMRFKSKQSDLLKAIRTGDNSEPYTETEIDNNKPILLEGWFKYYIFKNAQQDNQQKSNIFFKNINYYEQQKKDMNINLDEMQGTESKNVPTPTSFYLTVFKDLLNFSTDRKNKEMTIYDTVSFNKIASVPESGGFTGGLKLLKDSKYGVFCLRLQESVGSKSMYVICHKKNQKILQLANIIKTLIINSQRKNGVMLQPSQVDENGEDNRVKESLDSFGKSEDESAKLAKQTIDPEGSQVTADGYWIKLQDWSSCTKKCGTGTQSFHRMCIPPKSGGRPCKGKAVLTRDCNKDPCGNNNNGGSMGNMGSNGISSSNETIGALMGKSNKPQNTKSDYTMKPIVKVMPFSQRKQRYTKCIIKESDAMYVKQQDKQQSTGISASLSKIPVRIIMNNKTISIIEGTEYSKLLGSINLRNAVFDHTGTDSCFSIKDSSPIKNGNQNTYRLCPFGLANMANEWINQWDYDFHLFQNQCRTEKPTVNLGSKDEDKKKIDDQIAKAKADIIARKEKEIAKKLDEEEQKTQKKQDDSIKLEAIQKEFKIEDLLEKEENERERKLEQTIASKIDDEKNKRSSLLQKIKEKQIENQYNIRQAEADKDRKKEAARLKKDILEKRNKLKSRIEEIKRRNKRKRRKMLGELKEVRTAIDGDLKKAYHKGESCKCKFSQENDNKNYCKIRMNANPSDFNKCIAGYNDKTVFCEMCCNNENGDMMVKERADCLKKCLNTQAKGEGEDGIRWFAAEPLMKSDDILEDSKENKFVSKPPLQEEVEDQAKPEYLKEAEENGEI